MISQLRGILDSLGETSAIIDVGGVGYQVYCSARSLSRFPMLGTSITLLTELIIRDDAHMLLGFLLREERDWYKLLTSVQGVGMRVALSLLSLGEPEELAYAITHQDKAFIARAEGVGPKLAARIINELKDKVSRLGTGSTFNKLPSLSSFKETTLSQDALSALINLGYRSQEASEAIEFALQDNGKDVKIEQLIQSSLKRLSRS